MTVDDLLKSQKQLLNVLIMFLETMFCWNASKKSDKCEQLVNSIFQDICYAVANGKWMLPKHWHDSASYNCEGKTSVDCQ